MSLILASRDDIAVGKPLPWPLYDGEHKVLLEQGGVIRPGTSEQSAGNWRIS
jgi:hypothetical protein